MTGDPGALAEALRATYRYSDAVRSQLYGVMPWRVLLWPLSWRPPSHPPREQRMAALEALQAVG